MDTVHNNRWFEYCFLSSLGIKVPNNNLYVRLWALVKAPFQFCLKGVFVFIFRRFRWGMGNPHAVVVEFAFHAQRANYRVDWLKANYQLDSFTTSCILWFGHFSLGFQFQSILLPGSQHCLPWSCLVSLRAGEVLQVDIKTKHSMFRVVRRVS